VRATALWTASLHGLRQAIGVDAGRFRRLGGYMYDRRQRWRDTSDTCHPTSRCPPCPPYFAPRPFFIGTQAPFTSVCPSACCYGSILRPRDACGGSPAPPLPRWPAAAGGRLVASAAGGSVSAPTDLTRPVSNDSYCWGLAAYVLACPELLSFVFASYGSCNSASWSVAPGRRVVRVRGNQCVSFSLFF